MDKPFALTPNQIVAANLRRARLEHRLTQDEATARLEPHLGARWSRATYSAVEHSVDAGGRIRRFDADDLVALSKAFERPISYFLLPPPWADIPASGAPPTEIVRDVQTVSGVDSPGAMLERVLGVDEETGAHLRTLAELLSPDDRRALYGRLESRHATVAASRLGDLKKHARGLRELAELLEGTTQEDDWVDAPATEKMLPLGEIDLEGTD